MTSSTLTSKGQATIPKEIRDYLGVKAQERIAFSIDHGQVVLKRASYSTREAAGSLKPALAKPFPSEKQIQEASARASIEREAKTRP